MSFKNALGHFKTITHHKLLVMHYCFQVGLIRQGLMHDMSKYSWTEFRIGAKYYTGTHSPNAAERQAIGYSTAWLHHKGRNRHHLEYWVDYGSNGKPLVGEPMPTKYMVELCLDRIAACKVYHGKAYTDQDPLDYLDHSRDAGLMHPQTRKQVVALLTMLAQEGQAHTFRYIRQVVLKNPVKCYSNLPVKSAHPEEKDPCFLSGQPLKDLASTLPTPFYLYSQEEILERCRTLRAAFGWNPGHRQFFPVKATPTPAILRLLRSQGQGVVCSSASELLLCEKSGFSPEEILFMPNFPTDADIREAARLGCSVMLDGADLVEPYAKAGMLHGTVGLRVNPGGIFRFGLTEVRMEGVKFGMTPAGARDCIRALQSHGVRSIGLHGYFAGNTLEPEYYPTAAKTLLSLALELQKDTGISISYLNISGGLGIPYRPEDRPLDLMAVGQSLREAVEALTAGTPLEGIAIDTELGRWVTGPAGILVTRVCHVRRGFRNLAGVDASAADLMRPMMYGAYHHISVAGKEGCTRRQSWDVVGSVCENTDKFADSRMLPELEPGDVLAIHDAGAHGRSMGYQYGGRLRCGEYLLHGDHHIEEIRRSETPEDYLSTLIF